MNPLDISGMKQEAMNLNIDSAYSFADLKELSNLFPKKPKWDSKHRYGQKVKCSKCGNGGTLYNVNGKYYCLNCKKEGIQQC